MTNRSMMYIRQVHLSMLLTALFAGTVCAQPSTVSVVSKTAEPIGISDLRFLLGSEVQFQVFDFEAQESFCLLVGYEHEVDGQPSSSRSTDRGICNISGRQRLLVVTRLVGDQRVVSFSLHDRDTGMGGGMDLLKLSIGGISGAATFVGENSIYADRETTLFRWRYGRNPPGPDSYHDVHILVRLRENESGTIGTFYEPNAGS